MSNTVTVPTVCETCSAVVRVLVRLVSTHSTESEVWLSPEVDRTAMAAHTATHK